MLVLFCQFCARESVFFFSLPSADTEAVGRSFIPFVYYLPTTYYNCVNGERLLLTGKSFLFSIAGLHMSREIMLKWCKTKPTIESEYVRALSNLAMISYIYDIYI